VSGPAWAVQEATEQSLTISTDTARLTYRLPEPVSVQVFYGENFQSPDRSYAGTGVSNTIEVELDELTPGTAYYYRANFEGRNGQRLFFRTGWFRTQGVGPLKIEAVRALPGVSGAAFRVLASRQATGEIILSPASGRRIARPLSPAGTDVITGDLDLTRTVSVVTASVSGLKPLTRYPFTLRIGDGSGAVAVQEGGFTTLELNLALKKPVSGTFTNHDLADGTSLSGDVIGRAVDGNMNYHSGMSVSGDPSLEEQWLVLDLGAQTRIGAVVTFWRSLAYPGSYLLSFSADSRKWTAPLRVDAQPEDRLVETMPMKVFTTALKKRKARFLRLSVPAGTLCHRRFDKYEFVQLVELKVFPSD
jgi:hypothetical protein